MGDRGRDLKIAILSDVSQFDASKPADDLDDVATAADKSADELKRLATQGQDAQRELDRLADTGGRVDDAFDKIAASSKRGLGKVDDDAGRARKGLDEFKDEADSTAKEAAASFSDVESGLDAIQEVAANAFAGFGPAGKAAGVLAAVGIGVLFSGLQAASDKANEAKDRVIGMAEAISEAGGRMDSSGISDKIREWGYAIGDNKSWWELWQASNTTNIEKVADRAERLGLTFSDLFRGMSGSDPQAALNVMREIDEQIREIDRSQARAAANRPAGARDMVDAEKLKRGALRETRDEVEAALGMSEEAARLYALESDALERSAKAEDDRKASLSESIATIEAVGKAELTRADGTVRSIDEIIRAQRREIRSKRDFLKNTTEVLSEVGQAGVDWANSFGELAPQAMAELAAAPKKKQREIVKNFQTVGALAGEGTADALAAKGGRVARSAVEVYNRADAAVQALGAIGIKLGLAGTDIPYAVRLQLAEAQAYANRHPIILPPARPGGRPIRDVP